MAGSTVSVTSKAGACNHGLTDFDKSTLSLLWDIIPAVIAAYNTGQAIHFGKKQYEIAKDYLRISQWWRAYYNNFFVPLEDQELSEAMGLQETTPYYDTMRGRAQTAGRLKFKNAVNTAVQCTSEYCSGLRQQLLLDVLDQESRALNSLAGLGYRNERAYYESRSDVRWKRMINTAARGRDLQAQAINSAQLAYGIYGSLGEQVTKGAEGAASAFGYFHYRNDPRYPTLMTIQQAPQQASQQSSTQSGMTSGFVSNGTNVAVPGGKP